MADGRSPDAEPGPRVQPEPDAEPGPQVQPAPGGERDNLGQVDQPLKLANLPWGLTDERDPGWLPPWFQRAVVVVLILTIVSRVAVWGFSALESFWYTVFFAFFIGLAMEPLVNRLAARGVRRGVGTFLVMGGLLLGATLFFTVFGSLLASQMAQLIQSVPSILTSVLSWVNQTFGTQFNPNEILKEMGIGTDDIAKAAANVGVGLLSVLGTAIGWVFNLFTILLFAFYFAADGPRFRRVTAAWLPPARQRTFLTVWDISTQKAGSYVISRGIMAMISAAFHGAAFLILGLPYWLALALWVGLVSQFIPTIGTYLAGALPIVIALVQGDPVTALLVLAVVTVYQQIENYFVSPRVTRSTLEIHPAVAFGSVIVGSTLFGATGALLAVPVVATIQAVVSVYGRRYALVEEFGIDAETGEAERVESALRAASAHRPNRG